MSIITVLREECIAIGDGASDKQEVLKSIAALAKKSSVLDAIDEETIYNSLKKREDIASTGFEDGVAIPHCLIEGLDDFVIGIHIEPDGVDFDSLDKKKTKILVFIIGPVSERTRHIQYLSNISHTLRVEQAREEIISAKHPVEAMENFLRFASVETVGTKDEHTSLCFVIIQKEDKFQPILEIISATDVRGISVVDANDATHYLNKMPLFASIITDRAKGFNRIIISIINKSLVNEIIRQIDLEVGGLHDNEGVTVVIQNNSMTYGSMIL